MLLITIKNYSKIWVNKLKSKLIVNKPFSNIIFKKKDRNLSSSSSTPGKEENVKSKALIIFGFIISLASIFLLLFTIKSKFG